MKHFFVDTNVIIDVISDRKPFSQSAAILFDYSEKRKIKLFVSALSYSHIYYIVKKITSHKEMLKILRDLESVTETLDVTKEIIAASLHTGFKDFEDAIQYNTACSNKKVNAIITRNGKDYKSSNLPVLTAEEALSIIESRGE